MSDATQEPEALTKTPLVWTEQSVGLAGLPQESMTQAQVDAWVPDAQYRDALASGWAPGEEYKDDNGNLAVRALSEKQTKAVLAALTPPAPDAPAKDAKADKADQADKESTK